MILTEDQKTDLRKEIEHIFDSGVNQGRVFELVKNFLHSINPEKITSDDRYYLVTYVASNELIRSNGNVSIISKCFPSKSWLKSTISDNKKFLPDNVVIQNIFEFKSEEDFNNFNKEP